MVFVAASGGMQLRDAGLAAVAAAAAEEEKEEEGKGMFGAGADRTVATTHISSTF